ncbi:MAG TPA: hypothetical protein VF791_17845 [Pyrinomonadaceae bacterium]
MKRRVEKDGSQRRRTFAALILCAALLFPLISLAQQPNSNGARSYPKEIRGYKVELAKVEVKKQNAKDAEKQGAATEEDALIRLGEPRVASLTPFGITLEVPITVSAVKQGGRVDFLTFEEMVINGTRVTVNEYRHAFDLPNDRPLTLPQPLSIYISTPRAMLGVLSEWNKPTEVWPVRGRVYVFGHFKKFIFKFKRVVPLELDLTFRNPLRSRDEKQAGGGMPEGLKKYLSERP